jgi:hypothetical protein
MILEMLEVTKIDVDFYQSLFLTLRTSMSKTILDPLTISSRLCSVSNVLLSPSSMAQFHQLPLFFSAWPFASSRPATSLAPSSPFLLLVDFLAVLAPSPSSSWTSSSSSEALSSLSSGVVTSSSSDLEKAVSHYSIVGSPSRRRSLRTRRRR